MKNHIKWLLGMIAVIILTACGGGSSTSNDDLQTIVYDKQIDENITNNIDLENISLIIPENTVDRSTQLKIIESPESGGSASNIFDISSSNLIKKFVEMRIKVNNPSFHTEEDLVVVYQNEGNDTLHVSPSSYDGTELYTVTTHFSRWWAYPAAVLCASLGMGGEDEPICWAVQKEPTTEQDCKARFPTGDTVPDPSDGSPISILSEQCTDFTLPGECETCLIDKKTITGCLKGLIPASDGRCRAHECTVAELGTIVTSYTDGTSDQCIIDEDNRRVLVSVCSEGFIKVGDSCMAHECTVAQLGTTIEYTDGSYANCKYDGDSRRILEPFSCNDDEKLNGDHCTPKTCEADGYACPTCADGEVLKYNSDGSGYCALAFDTQNLFPIAISLPPIITNSNDVTKISLNGGSETIAGWVVGGVDLARYENNQDNIEFHLYDFSGPDSTQPYTFQTSNFTVTFYDNELNPVLSLRSEPFQFYNRSVAIDRALSIKSYKFTWTE